MSTPTLVVPAETDPYADAQAIKKACDGLGTNEKAIIEVICHRNESQRKELKEVYYAQYSQVLIKVLEDELSGNFWKAVYRWMLEPSERGAVLAFDALKKNDFRVLVEIACIASAEELVEFKKAYLLLCQRSLEEDVAAHFTGDMRKLLLLLVSVYRNDSDVTDPKLVKEEAKVLQHFISQKEYNHDEIIRILTTRSKAQLISTFYRFGEICGTPCITEIFESDQENKDFVAAIKVAILCIKSPSEYMEQVLTNALMKHENKEDALTRVVVTRAEKDLGKIKELFYQRNSRNLEDVVKKETHWDYKPFLLHLLGHVSRH